MYPFAYPTAFDSTTVFKNKKNDSASAEEITDSFYLDENY